MSTRYYHGGKAGLAIGDLVVPAPPHVEDGCPICRARAEGRVYTVREARARALVSGEAGRKMLELLHGAPPDAAIDPPTEQATKVYVTTDVLYATFYAARSRGDLYRVEPLGPVTRSVEDHFPSFITDQARVTEVVRRGVFLLRRDRREIGRLWRKADRKAERSRA